MHHRLESLVPKGLVLVFISLLVSITGTPVAAQTGAPPPPLTCPGGCPGWFLYHSNRSGNWEIYRQDIDPNSSAVPLNLSQGNKSGVDSLEPSISPNKQWIAYSTNRDGNWEIYISSTDGTEIRRITVNSQAKDVNPTWGDNNTLVFQSTASGAWDLYEIDLSNGDISRLTDNPGDDVNPSWSPSGWQIVFESNRSGLWQIYVLDRVTGGITLLSDGAGEDHNPVFSPDGSKILFRSTRDGNSVLYTMNADGTGLTQISDPAGNAFNATWSPDGSTIAYRSDLDGDQDIYGYNTTTAQTEKLTFNDVDDFAPAWFCDNTLLYNSGENPQPQIYHISTLNVDGVEDPTNPHDQITDDDADNLFANGSTISSEEIASKYNAMNGGFSLPPAGALPPYPFIGLQTTIPEPISEPPTNWEAIDGCTI